MREKITLACDGCKRRNYNYTRDKRASKDKLELRKFCPACRKHLAHREIK